MAERVFKIVALAIGALVIVAVGVFGGAMYAVRDEEGSAAGNAARLIVSEVVRPELVFRGRSRVNILLIGEDISLNNKRQQLKEFSRSDTNIVIGLDRLAATAHVLSLPRDTKVTVPGQGVHKLNAAHRYGGPFLLQETVRENFGLQIDHYIKTNFRGFVELVDLVGGIDVDVEREMDYDDSWQDFHVHLKPGLQHLTGEQAHGYVRWRKNNRPPRGDGSTDPKGDMGRTERQQKVIKILARKALSPQYLPRLRGMIRVARQYVETDLTDRQLLSLLLFLNRIDPEQLDTATLPATYTGFYVETDRPKAAELLARMFDYTFDSTRLMATSGPSSWDDRDLGLRGPEPARARRLEDELPEPAVPVEEPPPATEQGWDQDEPPEFVPPPAPGGSPPATPAEPPPDAPPAEPVEPPAKAKPAPQPAKPTPAPPAEPEPDVAPPIRKKSPTPAAEPAPAPAP